MGRLNEVIVAQKWSNYLKGDIDWVTKNEVKVNDYGYAQISSTEWSKVAFAADIIKLFEVGLKLNSKNDSSISQSDLVGSGNDCKPHEIFDKVLYRIITEGGKHGILKINSYGKKSTGGYFVSLDLIIEK